MGKEPPTGIIAALPDLLAPAWRVVESAALTEWFRRPRSKKRRIRNKWKQNLGNHRPFRSVLVDRNRRVIYVHPTIAPEIRRRVNQGLGTMRELFGF